MQTAKIIRSKITIPLIIVVLVLQFISMVLMTAPVNAAGALTSRSVALGSSAGNTSTTWTFTFSTTEATALNGITFQVCTTASGACSAPGSWTNAGSAFSSLTYNGSSQTGWALDNAAGYLRIKNNSSAVSVANPVVATFNTVTNPNTTNSSFFVRVLTFSGDDYTTQVDNGVVAASTTQPITLNITNPESLTFCTGTSVTGQNCGTIAGTTVTFAEASTSATSSGTSVMVAGTNGNGGYSITVNGTTLTCAGCPGTPTIAALASQTASSTGTSQFGLNLKDNATPNVGVEVAGPGSGTATANYGTADQYRFVTADSVASAAGATDGDTYTASYIVNVSPSQAAGAYTATMTYICTATF